MNEIFAVMCTPDQSMPQTKKALRSIKSTNLSGVELIVIDNGYDANFNHASMMQSMLDFADGAPVIFLDDDIIIRDEQWVAKLRDCAEKTESMIVGCLHGYESGECNHCGILVYKDGTTELMRELPPGSSAHNYYVPAVSSAVMFVADSKAVRFDDTFNKYQHDIDICLSAWKSSYKVACTQELKIVHSLGGYTSTQPLFREIYLKDSAKMAEKWGKFASEELYAIKELDTFADVAAMENWEIRYNQASKMAGDLPDEASSEFKEIIAKCPQIWRKASAYFHLYRLDGNKHYLEECLKLNPDHNAAKNSLHNHVD